MHSLPIASCEPAMLLADLANLPPKPPRSKLEPHRELIREGARLFSDRLGFHVAPSTLHSFVKVRARHRKQVQFELPPLVQVMAEVAPSSRVAALKAKSPASETKRTRLLNPDDEMLKILEAMSILALVTRHTPADIAVERERIQEMLDIHLQFAGEAQQRMLEYNQLLESRLAALPSEVEEGLNPEKVLKLLGESLRQHLAQTGIEDAANALQQTATALSSAQKRLTATFVNISDPAKELRLRSKARI